MDPDAVGKRLIFIADAGLEEEVVDIFLQSDKKMVGQITGLSPEGLATDAARNLYIANTGYMNILIYAPPYLTVKLTLGDGDNIPRAVAVSRKGLVAVANLCTLSNRSGNTGSVSFFAKGSTTACTTVADATNFAHMQNATFDGSASSIENFAFLRSGLDFYDADTQNGSGSRSDEFKYPTSGPPINTISGFELAWGVAVTPTLLP
jgi:hypothetical protein